MRRPREAVAIVTGHVLPENSRVAFQTQLPMGGEGWYKMRIVLHVTPTQTTATNPIVLGGYKLLQNVELYTSKNETIISCPGLGLYYLNWLLNHAQPNFDVNAGTTATEYDIILDIPFSHPLLGRQEDLVIDTGRYSSCTLELTVGGADDFFGAGTEGDATLAITADITLSRSKSAFEPTGRPISHPYIRHLPPYALANGFCEFESAKDLTLLGFVAMVQNMAASAAFDPVIGDPYSGVPADDMQNISFGDNVIRLLQNVQMDWFVEERAIFAGIDHADAVAAIGDDLTGCYPYIFAQEGTVRAGYWTGAKSEIRLTHNAAAIGSPTTPQVDVVVLGFRDLRP